MNDYASDDMTPNTTARRVQVAIKLARAGDKHTARRMLLDIVENDPTQENVWLWLAGLSEDVMEAKAYLETVLALNPSHVRAMAALRLVERRIAEQGNVEEVAPVPTMAASVAADPRPVSASVSETRDVPIPEGQATCPAHAVAEGRSTVKEVVRLAAAPHGTPDKYGGYVNSTAPIEVNAEIAPSFSLSVEQAEAIDACLERMAYESEASSIILADVTGQLISERGKTQGINTQVLSALAAGELSATQEMARLVGERARFSLLLHEGEERSVYLSPVGQKMLLIVVFDGRTPIGLVRIILKNAVEELRPIMERPVLRASVEGLGQALSGDFAQRLESEIDASLDLLN